MIIHELKIEKHYLKHLMSRDKKSEIRFNDRDYQKDDILRFYNSVDEIEVGHLNYWVHFKITHIHSGLGMAQNYVCLSLAKVDRI